MSESLINHWKNSGLEVAGACTDEEIFRFEAKEATRLPPDFRRYFLTVNGMKPDWKHDQDLSGFTFYPLDALREIPVDEKLIKTLLHKGETQPRPFIFADYLGGSWYYAIYLYDQVPQSNQIVIVSQIQPAVHFVVAASFESFVKYYLSNDRKIYPPGNDDEGKAGDK